MGSREWNGVKKIAPRNDPRTILNCSLHSTRPSRSIFTAWSARIFMEFKTLLWWSAVQCNAVPWTRRSDSHVNAMLVIQHMSAQIKIIFTFLRVPVYDWQVLSPLELRVLISIDDLHLLEHRALTRSTCTCIHMCNNRKCVSASLCKYPRADINMIHCFSKSSKFHSSSLSSNMIRWRKTIFQSHKKKETTTKTSTDKSA